MRRAVVDRRTAETDIHVELDLDGAGVCAAATGVGFLDHMLDHLAKHGLLQLTVRAAGDRHIDDHHTVEDVGIALGQALAEALGAKEGIQRYGDATVPMDEALATVAIDLSGRAACVWRVPLPTEKIGAFDTQLAEEFWRAVAGNAKLNFHAVLHHGSNSHHILEGVFKAAGRALRQAVAVDPRRAGAVPSTKGTL